MIDRRLMVRVDVASHDHMPSFTVTCDGLVCKELIGETFRELFGIEGGKVGAVGPGHPICGNNPHGGTICQIKISSNGPS